MYNEYNVSVIYKGYRIEFSEEKNLLLKETRGVGFEDVIVAIEKKEILGDFKHGNNKYGQLCLDDFNNRNKPTINDNIILFQNDKKRKFDEI